MAAAAVMALICFVSSNPSPQHWLVSGRVEAVARMDTLVATLTGIRRIAHAEDGDTGFSRYELGANPSNLILWPLLNHADHDDMVYSRFQHIVPSCPSGERSEVGNGRSELAMGLIGPVAAIRKLGIPLGAATREVRLEDGRTGLGFAPKDADRDVYDALVRRAAAGMLEGIDLVLMRPPGAIPSLSTPEGSIWAISVRKRTPGGTASIPAHRPLPRFPTPAMVIVNKERPMAIAAALAIMCYISPNPLPMRLAVIGAPAQIAAIKAQAAPVKSIRLMASAEDHGIAFAQFEIGRETVYRDISGLIFNAQRNGGLLATGTAIPSCTDGGAEDVGNPHAPLLVGLIGDAAALDRLMPGLAWARPQPMRLTDGRTGWRFAPGDQDGAAYDAFVELAAAGKFEGVEVVRLLTEGSRKD